MFMAFDSDSIVSSSLPITSTAANPFILCEPMQQYIMPKQSIHHLSLIVVFFLCKIIIILNTAGGTI